MSDGEMEANLNQVDSANLVQYGQTWELIEAHNLLHRLHDTSSFLKIELERVGKETGLVEKVRGYGTHLAFDCPDGELMQKWLWRNGINVGRCAPNTIALRPALILGCYQAAHLRNTFYSYHPSFAVNYD